VKNEERHDNVSGQRRTRFRDIDSLTLEQGLSIISTILIFDLISEFLIFGKSQEEHARPLTRPRAPVDEGICDDASGPRSVMWYL